MIAEGTRCWWQPVVVEHQVRCPMCTYWMTPSKGCACRQTFGHNRHH